MEPLGTITVYFEFIDEDTRKILESIMTETDNYFDFVNMLTQRVLNTDSSDLVVYFAIHHAAQLLDYNQTSVLPDTFKERPTITRTSSKLLMMSYQYIQTIGLP